MGKQLVIGLGTGRCGTHSLSRLLSTQVGVEITHESKPVLTWKFSEEGIKQKIEVISKYNAQIVGDVALYYLPYVEYILRQNSSAKFIGLIRDKEEVVDSLLRKTQGRNYWMVHDGKKWYKNSWDDSFPKYSVDSKKAAVERYWEDYYETVRSLIDKYPGRVRLWEMNYAFNTDRGVKEILSFAGVPEETQVIKANVHEAPGADPSWLREVDVAMEKLRKLVPRGDALILVDEEQLGIGESVYGRRRIPFLEKDSQYWGPPPDDITAIRELERLRGSGANFMVVAWPAFWWLEHYAEFNEYLRSQFKCVLENDRLVVFDLRP